MTNDAKPELSAVAALLLPPPDSALRCAEYNRSLEIDACGSALAASSIALVEVPLPWPKPVFDHPLLSGIRQKFTTPDGPGRVLATVPAASSTETAGTGRRVTLFERRGGGAARSSHFVHSGEQLNDLFVQLEGGGSGASTYMVSAPEPSEAVLVCTQGSHDVCCGTEGVRLADRLAEMNDDHDVFRVSHTGGHRFAPTAMTFPDGRMWAAADAALLAGVFDRTADVVEASQRCRGWWGAATGWAQVAERAVFARVGWAWSDADRVVEVVTSDGETAGCVVSSGGRVWDVVVETVREVPTIACRAEGGLPAKPGREYGVRSITER